MTQPPDEQPAELLAPVSPHFRPAKMPKSAGPPENWRESPEFEHWSEEVRKRAAEHLAANPRAKRALEIREPGLAAEALYLLAHTGMTKKAIAAHVGVYPQEIWRLERHHGTFELRRAGLAARMTNLSNGLARLLERKVDQIEDDDEQLSKTALKDIALSMGIVTDKAAALSNQPTVVIEHRSGPTIEDVMIEIQAARDRVAAKLKVQTIEAEVVPAIADEDDY